MNNEGVVRHLTLDYITNRTQHHVVYMYIMYAIRTII